MRDWDDDDEFEFEMIEEEYGEEIEDRRRENERKVREAARRAPAPQAEVSGTGCLTGIVMMAAVVTLLIMFPG